MSSVVAISQLLTVRRSDLVLVVVWLTIHWLHVCVLLVIHVGAFIVLLLIRHLVGMNLHWLHGFILHVGVNHCDLDCRAWVFKMA